MKTLTSVSFALVAGLVGGCQTLQFDESTSELSGATFTTLPDGSAVDANIYSSKEDVYIDGGPGANAPSGAAAFDAGDYYFQVTDPSGKVLLSEDSVEQRFFSVADNGLITRAFDHVTGIDQDHGGLTVQLMPYADTPNNGGEYKVWVTPVDLYDEGGGGSYGFLPRYSKTDNFKVREEEETPPPPVCGDGHVDEGEQCDDGNNVNGDGCENDCTNTPPPPPPPCCGDGHVDDGETCDDGNTTSGDGCSATCQVEQPPPPPPCCGDGHVDEGETCDDGNTVDFDGCSSTCQVECPIQ